MAKPPARVARKGYTCRARCSNECRGKVSKASTVLYTLIYCRLVTPMMCCPLNRTVHLTVQGTLWWARWCIKTQTIVRTRGSNIFFSILISISRHAGTIDRSHLISCLIDKLIIRISQSQIPSSPSPAFRPPEPCRSLPPGKVHIQTIKSTHQLNFQVRPLALN